MAWRNKITNLFNFLILEQAKGIDRSNAVAATAAHKDILNQKPFLKKIYTDFYKQLQEEIGDNRQVVIEIGSGGFNQQIKGILLFMLRQLFLYPVLMLLCGGI